MRILRPSDWPQWLLAAMVLMVLAIGFVVGKVSTQTMTAGPPVFPAESLLHASSTDGNDEFVIATGVVDQEVEGVFFLDPLSGDLQCTVYNPRSGRFNAVFRRNVLGDLQLDQEKRPAFLMVTGQTSLGQGHFANSGQSVGCIVYIVESHSGKFVAYVVPWNKQAFQRGLAQTADLVLLHSGSVRTIAVRE